MTTMTMICNWVDSLPAGEFMGIVTVVTYFFDRLLR
jgi:hypothetical protein